MSALCVACQASEGAERSAAPEPTAVDASSSHPGAAEAEAAGAQTPTVAAVAQPSAPAPELAPRHAVFDLYDNRFLAHGELAGGLVVPLGAPWGVKYMRGGLSRAWRLHERVDSVPVAMITDRRGRLWLPLRAEQAAQVRQVALEAFNPRSGQGVSLVWGGVELGTQTVRETGWVTLRFALPASLARAGENVVDVVITSNGRIGEVASGLAVATVAVTESSGTAGEWSRWRDLAQTSTARQLRLGELGLSWYLYVPDDAEVRAEVIGPSGCAVVASAEDAAGKALAEASWEPGAGSLGLAAAAGQVVLLRLRAQPGCAELTLAEAALTVPGHAPRMPTQVPAPRNVVIWLADTLRADHLSVYDGDTDVRTPNVIRFAREGVVFERVYSEGAESKVSHASLFTGLFPIRHGHYRSTTSVRAEDELLPEAMQRAGLETAGFISNGYISADWGFEQGWDTFVNTLREGRRSNAPALLELVRPWLDEHGGEPFFLYLGTTDPHVHYFRHEEFISLYDPNDADNMRSGRPFVWKVSGNQLNDIAMGTLQLQPRDQARMIALYKNEVSFNDKYFGAMLDLLEARGLREDTLVLLTSDHGDEFWEHGGVGHARTLYQHTVGIPLIVSYPPLFPPGTRVSEGVDLVDVYATLAELLSIDPAPPGLQGGNLAELANGLGAGYPRPTMATLGSRQYVFRLADYKLHVEFDGDARLHDLRTDEWERTDLSSDPSHALALRWMHDAFGTFIAYQSVWSKRRMGASSNLASGFAAEAL